MKFPPRPENISEIEFIRILSPYIFTQGIVKDKSILDIGCGFGHGTWLMISNGAKQVVAFDLDKIKTQQVRGFCSNFSNYSLFVMDAQRLGFMEQSFQIVTCFEVIEHIPESDLLLSEIQRTLKRDGILLLSTPNRAMRLLPLQRPWNSEHLCEYKLQAFQNILKKHFPFFEILGIYGEPIVYGHYKKMWKQSSLRFYLGFIIPAIRKLIPLSVRKWILHSVEDSYAKDPSPVFADVLNMVDPISASDKWPFYVSNVSSHCLNFFAICGFDHQIVQRSLNQIKGK